MYKITAGMESIVLCLNLRPCCFQAYEAVENDNEEAGADLENGDNSDGDDLAGIRKQVNRTQVMST